MILEVLVVFLAVLSTAVGIPPTNPPTNPPCPTPPCVFQPVPTPPPCGRDPKALNPTSTYIAGQCGGTLKGSDVTPLPLEVLDPACGPRAPWGSVTAPFNNACPGCADYTKCLESLDVNVCACEAMGVDFDLGRLYEVHRVRIVGHGKGTFTCGTWRFWHAKTATGPFIEAGKPIACNGTFWSARYLYKTVARYVRVVAYQPLQPTQRTNGVQVDEIDISGVPFMPPPPPPTPPARATRIVAGEFVVETLATQGTNVGRVTGQVGPTAARNYACEALSVCVGAARMALENVVSGDFEVGDFFRVPQFLSVTGSYTQKPKGKLALAIDAEAASAVPALYVSGGVTLAGNVQVELAQVPAVGDVLPLVRSCCTGAPLQGAFDTYFVVVRASISSPCYTVAVDSGAFNGTVFTMRVAGVEEGGANCEGADTDDRLANVFTDDYDDDDPASGAALAVGLTVGLCFLLLVIVAIGIVEHKLRLLRGAPEEDEDATAAAASGDAPRGASRRASVADVSRRASRRKLVAGASPLSGQSRRSYNKRASENRGDDATGGSVGPSMPQQQQQQQHLTLPGAYAQQPQQQPSFYHNNNMGTFYDRSSALATQSSTISGGSVASPSHYLQRDGVSAPNPYFQQTFS